MNLLLVEDDHLYLRTFHVYFLCTLGARLEYLSRLSQEDTRKASDMSESSQVAYDQSIVFPKLDEDYSIYEIYIRQQYRRFHRLATSHRNIPPAH